ncbi:hypothetical protein CXY01_19660 [Cellulomonas xylanilytica]|uniref:Uncharacterized protein n=2 Tax=Cellulomonas xylanilytica TaxID=233583 RepID=A0A510V3S0_9CELL|nr:hypothetical protein CXY01_19660 [Cellulomonas xylanilytica]
MADDGTSSIERRTTVRGGRTFHDDGSCGGFTALAGSGGPTGPVNPDRAVDRRTCPAGWPTAARLVAPEPRRLVPGAPGRPDGPVADGRPPAPPGVPVSVGVMVLLVLVPDGDPARRRTGDAAERIDAPAADAPPAAATTVGDMSRKA